MAPPRKLSEAERTAKKNAVRDEATSYQGIDDTGELRRGARWGLERRHVEELRLAGCTQAELLALAALILTPTEVQKLAHDLDSYGEWAV